MIPKEVLAKIRAALNSPGLPENLRRTLQSYLDHPFVMGGYTRHLQSLIDSALQQAADVAGAARAGGRRQSLDHRSAQLASRGGAGIATADEILDDGRSGIEFLDAFLPLYLRCAGLGMAYPPDHAVSLADLHRRYDAERGLSMRSYRADARRVMSAHEALEDVDDVLDDAGLQLSAAWRGAAAEAAIDYYRAFGSISDDLRRSIATAGQAIDQAMSTVESVVLDKARTVAALAMPQIGGFDRSVIKVFVDVAADPDSGPWKSVVLPLLAGRGDGDRATAQTLARGWLQDVFVRTMNGQIATLESACTSCSQWVLAAYDELGRVLRQVPTDPFRVLGAPGGLSTHAGLAQQIRARTPGPRDEPDGNGDGGIREPWDAGSVAGPTSGAPGDVRRHVAASSRAATQAAGGHGYSGAGSAQSILGGPSGVGAGTAVPAADSVGDSGALPAGPGAGGAGGASHGGGTAGSAGAGPTGRAYSGTDGASASASASRGLGHTSAVRSDAPDGFGTGGSTGGAGADAAYPVSTPVGAAAADTTGPTSSADASSGHGVSTASSTGHLAPALGMPIAGLARGTRREAAGRTYPVRDDIFGADELAEWERLGPVIGEGPS